MKSHSRLLVLTADHSEVAEPDWCTGSRERRGHMLDLASGIAVRGLPSWIEKGYQDETAPRRTLRGQVFGGGFLLVDLHCPERSPAHPDGRVYSVLVMAQESEYPVGAAVAIMQSRTADKVNNLPVRPRVPWAAVLIRRSDWLRASAWLPGLVDYLAYGWLEVCEEIEPLIQELEWYAVVERLGGWPHREFDQEA